MTDHWADFVRESEDRITELNNALLTLERHPDDEEAITDVFRIAHTLKGNCSAAGLEPASELAHAIEDVLDAVRGGDVDVSLALMDDVFEAVDDLERMIDDLDRYGEIETNSTETIATLRDHLEGPVAIERPSDAEIDAVLAGVEAPTDDDHEIYFVRISTTEIEEHVDDGRLVVEALIDAFELLGTAPSRQAIENGDYDGRFDAVFASPVGQSAIVSGLEPVDEVHDFELVAVTDRFEAIASSSEAAAGDEEITDLEPGTAPGDGIDTDQARELEVDDLLDEFDEFDDLDEMAEDVEGDDDLEAFEEMGDAGSFDDLLADVDDESETESEEPVDGSSDRDSSTAVDADAHPADEDGNVDDASEVFAELQEEVEMVGFDELQDELEELEFDEFDDEDEVGMDELLGEDAADDSFLEAEEPEREDDAEAVDEAVDADADREQDPDEDALESEISDEEQETEVDDEEQETEVDEEWLDLLPEAEVDDEAVSPEHEDGASEEAVEPESEPTPVESEANAETDPLEPESEPETTAESSDADVPGLEADDAADADTATNETVDSGDGDATTDTPAPATADRKADFRDEFDPEADDLTPEELVADLEQDPTSEDFGDERPEATFESDLETDVGFDDDRAAFDDEFDDVSLEDRQFGDVSLEEDGFDGSPTDSDEFGSFDTDLDQEVAAAFDGESELDTDDGFDDEPEIAEGNEPSTTAEGAEPGTDDDGETGGFHFESNLQEVPSDSSTANTGDVDTVDEPDRIDETEVIDEIDLEFESDDPFDSSPLADDPASETVDAGEKSAAIEPERVVDEPTLEIPDLTLPESTDRSRDDDQTEEIQSVRVDVDRIDELRTLVEGLVTTRVRLRNAAETGEDLSELDPELDDLSELTTALQETVMDVRLVPLETVVDRLPRVVRDVARDQEKDVSLEISGEDVELDRSILERIRDPLVHLVRNAVDHGIEPPEKREDAGKPREGTVEVTATRSRDRVTITVSDDGAGIDPETLRAEAVEDGILEESEAAEMDAETVYELAFHPGFSTAREVTDVSGRGVGMDVVKRTVENLDGSIRVDSDPGDGTTVTMTLPVSIAIEDVLFVECGDREFGLPTKVVQDIESPHAIETVDDRPVVVAGDDEYPVRWLDEEFDAVESTESERMLVRIRDDVRQVALGCDRVRGQQEVVVKPYEGFMGGVPGLSGATVRGRGTVVNILDVTTL
ncbi:chemotaxis protein CheA [Natronobacterium texcoconense]|uniref:Chemotaxis protein CheA n=1 Tax=Natronobacterium texcoconense TaxID=1095778 RepID=A0A1H1B586_NATTX|nr:chemotaxis protein CheA [Natronobacterium texcoconense]SDQ47053.1 two-component system, chemotaxis family, sensor kinase CheA [Natronobacterium texcoconense]